MPIDKAGHCLCRKTLSGLRARTYKCRGIPRCGGEDPKPSWHAEPADTAESGRASAREWGQASDPALDQASEMAECPAELEPHLAVASLSVATDLVVVDSAETALDLATGRAQESGRATAVGMEPA